MSDALAPPGRGICARTVCISSNETVWIHVTGKKFAGPLKDDPERQVRGAGAVPSRRTLRKAAGSLVCLLYPQHGPIRFVREHIDEPVGALPHVAQSLTELRQHAFLCDRPAILIEASA